MRYKVAVVTSAKHDPSPPPEPSTYSVIANAFATDDRYKECEVLKVPWDEPQDWTIFSHILMTDELLYVDYMQEFMTWMEQLPHEVRSRIINPYTVIVWNINKTYLEEFQAKGIRIAHTVFMAQDEEKPFNTILREIKDLMQANSEGPPTDIVIKNITDANGVSTKLVSLDNIDEAELVYKQAQRESKSGIMIQQYLPAIKEEGEWSLVFIDGNLSHGVHKTPKSGEFRVQGTYGGREESLLKEELPADICEFGNEVISANNEKLLYTRVDVVRNTNGQPCLMEFEAFEPSLYLFTQPIQKTFVEAMITY